MSAPADPTRLLVVGVSYRSAPVAVRERLAVASEERESVLHHLRDPKIVREAMVISTCNRVEAYACADDIEGASDRIVAFFSARVPHQDLRPYLYERRGRDAVLHVFRVASSLDSLRSEERRVGKECRL